MGTGQRQRRLCFGWNKKLIGLVFFSSSCHVQEVPFQSFLLFYFLFFQVISSLVSLILFVISLFTFLAK